MIADYNILSGGRTSNVFKIMPPAEFDEQ